MAGTASWVHTCSGCNESKLHAFWDDILGLNSANPNTVIVAVASYPKAPGDEAQISDEKVWIKESFELAKAHAYASPIEKTNGPSTSRLNTSPMSARWLRSR
jgi:hypothetical protein